MLCHFEKCLDEDVSFKEVGHYYCNPLGRSYAASTSLQAQLCQHLFGGSKPTSAVYNEDILNEEERKKLHVGGV